MHAAQGSSSENVRGLAGQGSQTSQTTPRLHEDQGELRPSYRAVATADGGSAHTFAIHGGAPAGEVADTTAEDMHTAADTGSIELKSLGHNAVNLDDTNLHTVTVKSRARQELSLSGAEQVEEEQQDKEFKRAVSSAAGAPRTRCHYTAFYVWRGHPAVATPRPPNITCHPHLTYRPTDRPTYQLTNLLRLLLRRRGSIF